MQIEGFNQFFTENPIPMWVYDPTDYSIKDVNRSMIKMYGYSKDEMLSFTLFDLRPPEEIPKLQKHLAQANTDGFSEEGIWKHQKKNGEYIYVHVITNPVSYEGDDRSYQLAMYKNLTGEMNAQLTNEMLYKYSLDGIMLTKPNGEILQANPAACKILGMGEQEIIQRGREGVVAADGKLQKALQERSETGRFAGELNFIHKEGHHIPVEVTSSVFINYTGDKRTSLIFRDIQDRKEREQAIKREKEFTETVLNSLPGVFFILDREGKVVRFNDHSIQVFGLPPEEVKGKAAREFVHEKDKQKVPDHIHKVLQEGYHVFELTLNIAGDKQAVFRFNAEQLEQDGQSFIIGTGIDITKQKELEEQLSSLLQQEHMQRKKAEDDRDKLREMFEEAPSPKCVMEGPEFRYVIANKAYRKVVGQENIIGKSLYEIIPEVEEQGYIDILRQVYQTGEPYIGQAEPVYIEKSEGQGQQNYIFNLLLAPLFDEEGEVYGIFIEAMDYSEQITYQKRLEESLKEKETLLTEIHHRVKNNLAIITSMMELQALETDSRLLENSLRTAQQRIQTIATIHELLYSAESLSHINFGENIGRLVKNLDNIYSKDDHISVNIHADPISLNINQAIPCALLVNEVVTNAYKHAFTNQKEGTIDVRVSEDNDKVNIIIKDNGKGIPENIAEGATPSIGITLIKMLEQQLEGTIKYANKNGTEFGLVFAKTEVKGIGSNLIEN